jgi:hypothetical protein
VEEAAHEREDDATRARSSFPRLGWGFFWHMCFDVYSVLIHGNTRAAKCRFGPIVGAHPDVGFGPRHTWFEAQSTPILELPNEASMISAHNQVRSLTLISLQSSSVKMWMIIPKLISRISFLSLIYFLTLST